MTGHSQPSDPHRFSRWPDSLLLAVLLLPVLALPQRWGDRAAGVGAVLALVLVAASLPWPRPVRLLALPCLLLAPPVAWYAWRFGVMPGDELMLALRMSDGRSAVEFLADAARQWSTWAVLILEVLVALALKLRRPWPARPRWRQVGLLCGLAYLATGFLHDSFLRTRLPLHPWASPELVLRTYPLSLVQPLVLLATPRPVVAAIAPVRVKVDPAARHRPQTYVLVIGESARADRLGLNGYGRDTTPILGALPGVVSFPDVRSVSDCTHTAVPAMLTMSDAAGIARRPPDEGAPTLFDYFAAAGFFTAFVSMHEPALAEAIGIRADHARNLRYLNPGSPVRDDALLPELRRLLLVPQPRKFIVLQLIGSHFEYEQRYPADFDVFHGDGTPERDRSARYDNSLRYTDWILSRVIEALHGAEGEVVLAYASDHGENLYDDARQRYQHCGSVTHFDTRPATLFWAERLYRPQSWQTLAANRGRYIGQEMVGATLLDLAGVRVPGVVLPDSLAAPLVEREVRYVLDGGKLTGFARDGSLAP